MDDDDGQYLFTIVGEDEADVDNGLISWISPLARELIGKKQAILSIGKDPQEIWK